MIRLLPDGPAHDREAGRASLRRLLEEYPDSRWSEPSRLVLALDAEIARLDERSREQREEISELTERLEALKRIDLEHSEEPPPR